MYTEHFSLKEKPFNLTPSPRFLYLSESHKEALALLTYGVMERKGFVLLTGEVGTGKTTILHTLLQSLDKRVQCVHLSNPLISAAEFIDYLSHSVFKTGAGRQSKTEFLLRFEEYLRKSAQQQSNFLLVIDEAQKLSFELLEEIRLLSNMETADEKLINIFLVGQPELNQKLNEVRCRPLLQRISIRHHISPLSLKETGEYIVTRLKVAGAKDAKWIFPSGVIRSIHRLSKGFPRMINILADNALLSAYSNGAKRVSSRMVEQCYADLHLGTPSGAADTKDPSWSGQVTAERRKVSSGGIWKWGAALSVGIAATVLGLWVGNGIWTSKTEPTRGGYESPAPTPPKPMVMQPIFPPPVKEIEKSVSFEEKKEIKAGSAPEPGKTDLTWQGYGSTVMQPTFPPPVKEVEKSIPTGEKREVKADSASEPRKTNLTRERYESQAMLSAIQPLSPSPAEKTAAPLQSEALPLEEKEDLKVGNARAVVEAIRKEEAPVPEAAPEAQASLPRGEPPRLARWVIAKKGDTLSKLAVDVYGRVDDRILNILQKNNPSIWNIHWIAIGQEIYFPAVRMPEENAR